MSVIVEHRETRDQYVLLGTGFGAYLAKKPNWFLGNLSADVESGEVSVVAICDAGGNIGWYNTEELVVVSVDGQSPGEALRS